MNASEPPASEGRKPSRGRSEQREAITRPGGRTILPPPASLIAEGMLLAGLLAWAALLRLGWPGVNPFAFDEARLSLLALELARRGEIPLLGLTSSAGVPNLLGAVWLFAIPYALSSDPLVASEFVGASSVVAVLLLWWMARKAWGPPAGLVVAALAAGSPYLALYSRSVWGQNWLPILGTVWAFAAFIGLTTGSAWAIALHTFVAGFAPQVHYAGAVLILPSLVLLLRFRSRLKPWLAGWAVSLLIALPSLGRIFALMGDTQARAGLGLGIRPQSLSQLGAAATGYNWDWLFIGGRWGLSTSPPATVLAILTGALILAGLASIAAGARRARTPAGKALAFLASLWAASSLAFWMVNPVPVRIHYHLAALPGLFLTAGAAAWSYSGKKVRLAALALALLLSLGQGWLFTRALDIAGREATPGGISAPLKFARDLAGFLRSGGLPAVVLTPGDDPRFDGDAAVLHTLLWGYPHRLADGRHVLLIPGKGPAWLVFAAPWMPAWQEALSALPQERREVYLFPRREGEYPYGLIRWSGGEPGGFEAPTGPGTLANGATLAGWKLLVRGDSLHLVTLWRIGAKPSGEEDFHQFNHLYVDDAARPLEVQDIPTSSRAWREGDYLLTWVDFARPEGVRRVRFAVGMYRYPSLERVPLLGAPDPTSPIWLEPQAPLHRLGE